MSMHALRDLRAGCSSDDALAALEDWHVEHVRLGITVHAGEDFEDPITGLRHVWETAVDLDLGDGDRIGHALAAGLDRDAVRTLFERRAEQPGGEVRQLEGGRFLVRKPRGTHLLDLAWICRMGGPNAVREAELRLGEIASRIFGAPADAARLARALNRSDGGALAGAALPGIRFEDPGHLEVHDLETVVIDTPWLALFESLRGRVLDELVRRKIVVESCPTSNLVVANLDQPPILTLAQTAHLQVALATDDPGLLGVFPRAEITHVRKACQRGLLQASVAEQLARRVIQATAHASFVTRAEDEASSI